MATTIWKPEYTIRALEIWEVYQKEHDLSGQRGKVAAIDPQSRRVWIGDSGVDIAEQMKAEGIETPVYLVRVGAEYFLQKGRR